MSATPYVATSVLLVVVWWNTRLANLLRRRCERVEAGCGRAESRWNLLVHNTPLAMIGMDAGQRVLEWNPAAEKLFGYTRAEAMGKSVVDLIVPEPIRERERAMLREAFPGEKGGHHVTENVDRQGRALSCHWYLTGVAGESGEVELVCLAHDLTEAREVEERMRHSQKIQSIGLLAAGVAHDFNNLLTIIQGANDALYRHFVGQLDPETRFAASEQCERVAYASQRAAALTRQLLCFSRQTAMRVAKLDVNAAVEACAQMLSRLLGENVKLRLQLSGALPSVQADANLLEQVLTNLVVNARDALPKGGLIRLSTAVCEVTEEDGRRNPEARPGTAVRITVMDNGTGIPAERLKRIFEPFFTTKDIGKGTGLGLSAVHGIVQQHGGWVVVRSWVNRGTSFDIFLPAASASPVEAARAPDAPTTATLLSGPLNVDGSTVLLVEDQDVVRELCRETLEAAGCEVHEAACGADALRLWAERGNEIDVLFTDMMMPGPVNGLDLAKLLRTDRPTLPIVFCSGYSPDTLSLGEAELDPIFLPKPFRPPQVIESISAALRREKRATSIVPLPGVAEPEGEAPQSVSA